MAATAAKPATFASNPRRRSMLAIAHIAPQQLGMDDDDRAATLMRVNGRMSAAHCTDAELERLAAEFRRLGFRSAPRTGKPPRADHALARKARVMWISLAHLCAVREAPEDAIRADKGLEAFAQRQLGCARFQWANQNQADKLVEALKAWAQRHGWDQSQRGLSKATYVHALKVRLADAILVKLKRAGIAAADWTLGQAAFRLTGIEAEGASLSTQDYERIAAALGRKLRDHGGDGAFLEVAS